MATEELLTFVIQTSTNQELNVEELPLLTLRLVVHVFSRYLSQHALHALQPLPVDAPP